MLSPKCVRSLTTIGYEKALADRKSDNNNKKNNKNNVGGAWSKNKKNYKQVQLLVPVKCEES